MPEEVTPSAPAEESPELATGNVVPTNFREYVKWRTTGEPAPETKQEEAPAAAEETPPAKTAPDSEPDNTPDQEPEEEDSGEESSEEEPAGHKRPGSRQRKIDRLTREKEDLAQENEELKRRIVEKEKPPPPAKKAEDEGRPKLEDFQSLQDYMRADMEWLHVRESAKQAEAAKVAKVQSEWDAKEKDAAKAHPDYEDVVYALKVPEGPGVMSARLAMLEHASGAEILYYLAKRPQDMKRIAALDPIHAVIEIGRISAMIESSAVPENNVKRITSAPKPPPAVGRPAKTSSDDINDPEVVSDYKRWERLRMAELRSK